MLYPNASQNDMLEPSNHSTYDIESSFALTYGTFGSKSYAGGSLPSHSLGETAHTNPFNTNNHKTSASILLSPSYSRRSTSCGIPNRFTGCKGKMPELYEGKFLLISKYVIIYLTFICCALFANMTQMIVLYHLLSDDDEKKYILIYIIFPFVLFLFLKINDVYLCNQITFLFNCRYHTTASVLNRNREILHVLTFIGYPLLWTIYPIINSDWIKSMEINANKQTFGEFVTEETINTVLITLWTIIQFIEFIISIIALLYCIQHNTHRQESKDPYNGKPCNPYLRNYSLSITNAFSKRKNKKHIIISGYIQKIKILERQLCALQTDLIKSKQERMIMTANSQLSIEYDDEMQEQNQKCRALLSERDLLRTECENRKSLLNIKKQQCKQQQTSIKSLQQIREENIQTILELKKKLTDSRKEIQKLQILLQIERQNVRKAQQYFEQFA